MDDVQKSKYTQERIYELKRFICSGQGHCCVEASSLMLPKVLGFCMS